LKKFLKLFHTLSAIGISAILICHFVLLIYLPEPSLAKEYFSYRELMAAISNKPLIFSLALVLVSGLFSMAMHTPFHNSGWVWMKAALGLLMFEWILIGVSGPAQKAFAIISHEGFELETERMVLEELHRQELGSVWIMLIVVIANVVLAVWRPGIFAKKRTKVS
jgi:hypothetical protein